jgi:hypothetical protein
MKKQFTYMVALLLAFGGVACTQDYQDWADPQSNPEQEATSGLTGTFTGGADAAVVMDNVTGDSLEVLKLSSWTAPEGSTLAVKSLTVDDTYSIPFGVRVDQNTVTVPANELAALVQSIYNSRASVARNLKLTPTASAITQAGEALILNGTGDVTITLKPKATPALDPDGYYLVGSFNGWTATGALALVQDPNTPTLYTLTTDFTATNNEFKVLPAAALASGSIDWSMTSYGSTEESEGKSEGLLEWNNGKNLTFADASKVKITLDFADFRFSVKDDSAPTALFMTGSEYGWGGTWKEMTPVNDTKGSFWGLFYFGADSEVKFAPQADWGGDFGYTGSTISETSISLAGLSESGGNIKVGTAGWYIVFVSAIGNDHTIEFYAPNVFVYGDTNGGTWEATDAWKLTVPTDGSGEFVSPALAADGEVRLCINLPNIDWWRTEFIILNGQIAYRGNGGDQERVRATAGQKVHLNFTAGTGSIQ